MAVTVKLRQGEGSPSTVKLYPLTPEPAAAPLVVHLYSVPSPGTVVLRTFTPAPAGGPPGPALLESDDTLDGVTTTATTTVRVQAAASTTLDDVTATTATATVFVLAASAGVLDDVSTTAAAIVRVQATTSTTLDDVSTTATTTVQVKAQASVTLDDVGTTGTATVRVQATASVTLDDVATLATAEVSGGEVGGLVTATISAAVAPDARMTATATSIIVATLRGTVGSGARATSSITRPTSATIAAAGTISLQFAMPAIQTFNDGTRVRLAVTFEEADEVFDPAVVIFKIKRPNRPVSEVYTYPNDAEIVRDSEGVYHFEFVIDWSGGTALYRWQSTATNEEVTEEGKIVVPKASF